jgi:hypothetical protein
MSLLRKFYALCLVLLLASCHFTPVYQKDGQQEALRHIKVDMVRSRDAQLFAIALEDKLYRNAMESVEYTLTPIITIASVPLSIEQDGTALRYRVTGNATYTLKDKAGKVIGQGAVERISSYNISDANFSRYVSEIDAREQVIEGLAEAMRMELIQFFYNRDIK